ncbi:hypothetical protein [Thermosynechococcus sp.]|uniref:hypothetical protein n=1 Tax=Thermosynechococcus sp. TaxID=2814275 RepID=UPI00391B498F
MEWLQLETRVPIIKDQLLVDLVNGIHISQSLLNYRKSRGFFGRLLDGITGRTYAHETEIGQNLVRGQQALVELTTEIIDKLSYTEYALEVTQHSLLQLQESLEVTQSVLLENQQAIAQQGEQLERLTERQDFLKQALVRLIGICDRRFQEQQEYLRRLDLRISAQEDFERILSSWRSGKAYADLPFSVQVMLLARETFSSTVGYYEYDCAGNRSTYRERLCNEILTHLRHDLPKYFFLTTDLLQATLAATASNDLPLLQDLLSSLRYSHKQPLAFLISQLYSKPQWNFLPLPKGTPHTLDAEETIQRLVEETRTLTLAQLSSPQ